MRPSNGRDVDVKRLLDLVLSAGGLLLTAPLLGVVAVAIRLDSPGPALFRQERVGRHGQIFWIHKFRTLQHNAPGPLISPSHDARVTRVGEVLRRTKLDELPQLLDVLAGHMSLVGPRPEVPRYVALWPPAHRAVILSVRPGITDPASILLRHEADELAASIDPEHHYVTDLLPRKTALYLAYVNNRTLLGDLRLLGQTVRAVLHS